MKGFKIFIAEDDVWYSELLRYHLELNPDYEIRTFESGKKLIKALHEKPDVITLDYSMPDTNGEQLLSYIKKELPETEVVIISGQEDISTAIGLLKEGAYDYLVKDDETKEKIWQTILHIRENSSLKHELNQLRDEVRQKYDFSKTIKGNSEAIKKTFNLIEKAVITNITVSITGETGTGKEVIAKAIHYNSDRKKEPFIAINVSAIPSELIESELFGHERGAFTGAQTRRKGKFEEAGRGTIMLDEIGEMDLNMQSKLLRVLQEKEVVRIGGNEQVKLNCRIIVATHRDLLEEVKKGNFREDLYYRLLGLPIELPPLRKRREDVLILAKYFIEEFSKENGILVKQLSEKAINKLMGYNFPGNIRELKAIIELAIVLADGDIIDQENINYPSSDPLAELLMEERSLKEYNDKIIQHFLNKHNNNVIEAAKALNIGKSTIYRMLKDETVQI
ncbi:MAG: regulator [Flavobacteriales bacterium]|nr:MAG: regulator [Flavobacteriales bacterium]